MPKLGTFYHGERRGYGVVVEFWYVVNGEREIRPLRHIRRHSPSGFEWGSRGSGPAELALAICAHAVGVLPPIAVYQFVKADLIATITGDRWDLTTAQVLDSIARAGGKAGTFQPQEVRA
jgi:hypothetical protein